MAHRKLSRQRGLVGPIVVAGVVAVTGCGSSSDDSALQSEVDALIAERDALEARVDELEARLEAAADEANELPSEEPEQETTEPPAAEPEATMAPTNTGVAVSPAPPDASPYVFGFGEVGVLSLPEGDPGAVAIIASTVPADRADLVTIIVRNNTGADVGRIEVTGTARDGQGALVGSGASQGFQPQVVAPGEIAFGYVFFGDDMPPGSTFEFNVGTEPVGDYFLPITITEVNVNGDQIVGLVRNDTGGDVSGPISVDVICFNSQGGILDNVGSYAEQDDLPPDGGGSFAIDLYGDPCPIGLVASSGYD